MNHMIIETTEKDFGFAAKRAFLEAIGGRKGLNITLPTGSTPLSFYAALREGEECPEFTYVQMDEFLGLQGNDERRFARVMDREVLHPLGIKSGITFNSSTRDPEGECERFQALLNENGGIHIAVIGIGTNGHVAYNEPGSPFDSRVRVVELASDTIAQNEAGYAQDPYRNYRQPLPKKAMTIGIADFAGAEHTILLVRGESKAEILRKAFNDTVTSAVPASYLQEQPNVTIVADAAALSKMLRKRSFSPV